MFYSGSATPDDEERVDTFTITYSGSDTLLMVGGLCNPPAVTIETDDDGNETLYLYNSLSYDIPVTGLFGTTNFYKAGTILVAFGFCVLIITRLTKRKVSINKTKGSKKSARRARRQ